MLSYEKSERPWKGLPRLFEPGDQGDAPATPEDLIEIRLLLRETAGIRHGRFEHLVGHVMPHKLRNVDHLIAVHVLGYEYRPPTKRRENRWHRDLAWRTGLGSYSDDATSLWTTDVDVAFRLVRRFVPLLRMDIRFGGAKHGQVRKARFDEKHATLAGQVIPLPEEWAYGVSRYPAIAIVDTFLTAFAMQKAAEEAPASAASTRESVDA